MAESKTNKILLSSAYEYTKLYRYVFAIRELQSRKGPHYERAKELIPDIDQRLKGGTVKDYNQVIVEATGAFPGLEGMTIKDLRKLAIYARDINSDKSFPPTLDQVNECKQHYDENLVANHKKTSEELEAIKDKRSKAKKSLSKARGKLAGSVLLGALAVGGLAALGVGFGLGIVSVVSSAISGTVAGLASGFAIGGIALGIIGARVIVKGIVSVFKKVVNNIKAHNKAKNEAKEQYKKLNKGYNQMLSRMHQLDNQMYVDRVSQSDELSKYPGSVPEPEYLKTKVKEKTKGKVKTIENEIEEMVVTNKVLTEEEKNAQVKEYINERKKKYDEFENNYGDEEKRKELDPDNPNDKEILNYFEERKKFYQEFDKKLFPLNPVSTEVPTIEQINTRYSSDVQRIIDKNFKAYMLGTDMNNEFGGEFDSEKLRQECIAETEKEIKSTVSKNIKEFEGENNYFSEESFTTQQFIAADKAIEVIEKSDIEVDEEVVKELSNINSNANVVPETITKQILPEEEVEDEKEAEEIIKKESGVEGEGFGTKDTEIEPSVAGLDMKNPEDRLILYKHALGLMKELEDPKTKPEQKAKLQAKIEKLKDKYPVLESAKDSKVLEEMIASEESKLGKGSGKKVKAENEATKVSYEQAVEAVKGFSELTVVAGGKSGTSSQLRFALDGKNILTIEKKGDDYVLINQNGTLDSKDIKSVEDVKKFVSETIEKNKEVKAENEEPKIVEVNIDPKKVSHKRFLECFDNDEEAAKEFIADLPKEKQAELKELLAAKGWVNSDKIVAFVKENKKEVSKEEPKKEEKVEMENDLDLNPSTNKAYAEMISSFGGPKNFTKVLERLSDEELDRLVKIMNDPEVLENSKSPKVEEAYDILRKHRLDMEKELTDEQKEEQKENDCGFEDALAICRSIDGLKETVNEDKTQYKFSYNGKLCMILQKTDEDYRLAYLSPTDKIMQYIVKNPRVVIKPSKPEGDNWLLLKNKNQVKIGVQRKMIVESVETLKHMLEVENKEEPKAEEVKEESVVEQPVVEFKGNNPAHVALLQQFNYKRGDKKSLERAKKQANEFINELPEDKRAEFLELLNKDGVTKEEIKAFVDSKGNTQEKEDNNQKTIKKLKENQIEGLRARGYDLPNFDDMPEEMKDLFIKHGHDVNYMRKHLQEDFGLYPKGKAPVEQEQPEEVSQEQTNIEKLKELGIDLDSFDYEGVEKEKVIEKINKMSEEELQEFIKNLKEQGKSTVKGKPQPEADEDALGK